MLYGDMRRYRSSSWRNIAMLVMPLLLITYSGEAGSQDLAADLLDANRAFARASVADGAAPIG